MSTLDRFEGALLGLACGDAVGTTLEFRVRGSFAPLTDMVGGGPFSLRAGQWTDDTSMALCLAESLVAKGGCDPGDQMARYANWYQWGYWSSTGHCFDIGMATREAIQRYLLTGNALAGSGPLGVADGVDVVGVLRQPGQHGAFGGAEGGQRFAKVGLRGGLKAVGPRAQINLVHVQLQIGRAHV